MCEALSWTLKPGPCPPTLTSIYTCGVTIVLRVCGGNLYEKPTKAKSNFDSNQIFSKFWLYIYIYIYTYLYWTPHFLD